MHSTAWCLAAATVVPVRPHSASLPPPCLPFPAGVLSGALVSGVQMAVSMSNTGGAWDNAKKYIEAVSPGVLLLLLQAVVVTMRAGTGREEHRGCE